MSRNHFFHQRQRYEVIDRMTIGWKTFLVTRQLSGSQRQRFLAFDPHAGPGGALRVIQLLPPDEATWQRVQVLQRLGQRHAEWPAILEFHRRSGDIVLVQAWVEGRDLHWWIAEMRRTQQQRMGTPEAMRLFRGLAHALYHYHHHCHLVHADIAPANIIFSPHSRRLVFIDFGSAWTAERTAFRCAGDGSRPVYAALEYAADSIAVDFRADYFSLAAVGYEILTQQVPYDGLGGRAGSPMYREQSDSLYIPPSQLSREAATIDRRAWTAIDALLGTALQIDRDKRFATGQEWLNAWQSVHDIVQQPAKRSWIDRLLFRFAALFDRTPPANVHPTQPPRSS